MSKSNNRVLTADGRLVSFPLEKLKQEEKYEQVPKGTVEKIMNEEVKVESNVAMPKSKQLKQQHNSKAKKANIKLKEKEEKKIQDEIVAEIEAKHPKKEKKIEVEFDD